MTSTDTSTQHISDLSELWQKQLLKQQYLNSIPMTWTFCDTRSQKNLNQIVKTCIAFKTSNLCVFETAIRL